MRLIKKGNRTPIWAEALQYHRRCENEARYDIICTLQKHVPQVTVVMPRPYASKTVLAIAVSASELAAIPASVWI
jgi:hypothetical protein